MKGTDSDSICIHHINGDHYDDRSENRAKTHFGCHSRFNNAGEKNTNFGKPWTEERKKKQSLAMSGEKHWMYGKDWHPSKESKKKNRLAHLGEKNHMFGKRGKDNPNYGSKRTEETKEKMREYRINISPEKKKEFAIITSKDRKRWWASLTPEERAEQHRKMHEGQVGWSKGLNAKTDERVAKNAQKMQQYWDNLSPDGRTERGKKSKNWWDSLTLEQRAEMGRKSQEGMRKGKLRRQQELNSFTD